MELKKAAMAGVIIGSTVGSFIPLLWGDSYFSLTSVFLTAIGGIAGIYIAYKLVRG